MNSGNHAFISAPKLKWNSICLIFASSKEKKFLLETYLLAGAWKESDENNSWVENFVSTSKERFIPDWKTNSNVKVVYSRYSPAESEFRWTSRENERFRMRQKFEKNSGPSKIIKGWIFQELTVREIALIARVTCPRGRPTYSAGR